MKCEDCFLECADINCRNNTGGDEHGNRNTCENKPRQRLSQAKKVRPHILLPAKTMRV